MKALDQQIAFDITKLLKLQDIPEKLVQTHVLVQDLAQENLIDRKILFDVFNKNRAFSIEDWKAFADSQDRFNNYGKYIYKIFQKTKDRSFAQLLTRSSVHDILESKAIMTCADFSKVFVHMALKSRFERKNFRIAILAHKADFPIQESRLAAKNEGILVGFTAAVVVCLSHQSYLLNPEAQSLEAYLVPEKIKLLSEFTFPTFEKMGSKGPFIYTDILDINEFLDGFDIDKINSLHKRLSATLFKPLT